MNSEIRREDCYKQVGQTCGIYAFINAMIDYNDKEIGKVNEFAYELWDRAIDIRNGKINNCMDPQSINYSLIGEFASSQNIVKFLIENKSFINKRLKEFGKKDFKGAEVINDCSVNNEGTYLIVVRAKKRKHLVFFIAYVVKNKNEIYEIKNSSPNCEKQEKNMMQLIDNSKNSIQNAVDLQKLIKKAQYSGKINMYNVPAVKFHKWPCSAKINFIKIKLRCLHRPTYCYNDNSFCPIRIITYEDK